MFCTSQHGRYRLRGNHQENQKHGWLWNWTSETVLDNIRIGTTQWIKLKHWPTLRKKQRMTAESSFFTRIFALLSCKWTRTIWEHGCTGKAVQWNLDFSISKTAIVDIHCIATSLFHGWIWNKWSSEDHLTLVTRGLWKASESLKGWRVFISHWIFYVHSAPSATEDKCWGNFSLGGEIQPLMIYRTKSVAR